ncbi:hypothetical protein JGS22_002800 [Streptomyces sp. P38-E01]|uniref:Uncharacterized protein n=1 Tax=Streptomyces tardus TaxID=2780544 RepID=A0A949JBV1_9ACTN|nr:hypothetical protein [Streptomyces tardus]MBU7596592.1 hypothetical protein [Streptomyces tardus]
MTTFQEEWAQLKADAARTKLASADGSGDASGTSGQMKSDRAAWRQAAKSVGGLPSNTAKPLASLEKDQSGFSGGSGTPETESGAAQRALFRSWKTYMTQVNKRCTTLESALEKAGSDQSGNEQDVRDSFTSLSRRYKDTPELGGQKQGK